MREPRQVIADWYGDDRLAEIGDAIIGALEAEGYRIVGEGQACIGGEVVRLTKYHPTTGPTLSGQMLAGPLPRFYAVPIESS